MPRGPRKSIEDKIREKEEIVKALKIRIDSEQKELKELFREKADKDMQEINSIISEAGLSPEEAADILRKHVNKE